MPTLLCVDSDRSYCEILARAFRAEGYDVHVAHDGETALERCRALRPDLVTLEILLPRRDGFAVLEALRGEERDGRRTPVLLLTGCSPTPAYRTRAQRLGATGLVTKPVALDRLLALVAKQIGAAARAPAARAPAPRPGRATAPLEGSLRDAVFPALLHHLHGLRASGVLHLEYGKKKKKLQLEEGRPVAVKSNLVGETLGQLLAASGKISLDVMHESVKRIQRGEGLQGQILVAMHMLDEADLSVALRTQAEEKLFEIFGWSDGSFRFERGARLQGGNTLSLKGSPANLITKGVFARTPREAIDAFFGEHRDRRVIQATQPFYRFQEIDLDLDTQGLLAEIDGTRTLMDLLPLDERARRALYALAAIEMIELAPAPARASRPFVAPPVPNSAPRVEKERPLPAAAAPPAPNTAPRVEKARPLPAAAPRPPAAPAAAKPGPRVRPAPPERSAAVPAPTPPVRAAEEQPLSREEEALRAELAAMAEKLRGRDFFAILGVQRTATDDQIREAYFSLAKRTHPDRFSSAHFAVRRVAEELFALISQAYDTLGTRERRNEYLRAELTRERDRADIEEGERALRAEIDFQKGVTLLRKKSYAQAAELFETAVGHYPDEGEYHAYLGWALWLSDPQATGRLEQSRNLLLRGRKLAPTSDKPYLFLGRLYKAEGKDAQAEKMFQKVIELDPDCVDAIRELRLIDMRRLKSKSLVSRILRR